MSEDDIINEPDEAAISGVAPKRGRPPKLIADDATLAKVKALGQIKATHRECAAFLSVAPVTFEKFMHRKAVRDAYEAGHGSGNVSLRRKQWEMALGGNTRMSIWLGKQHLGQVDRQEFTGTDGAPLQVAGPSSIIVIHDNGRDTQAD